MGQWKIQFFLFSNLLMTLKKIKLNKPKLVCLVLIIMTLTFIQGHTDLNHQEINAPFTFSHSEWGTHLPPTEVVWSDCEETITWLYTTLVSSWSCPCIIWNNHTNLKLDWIKNLSENTTLTFIFLTPMWPWKLIMIVTGMTFKVPSISISYSNWQESAI